jgi:cobalt/nickel transport system permease protein
VKRRGLWWLVGGGLVLALVLAFAISPFASSDPDGLERVAIDRGFDDTATEHAAADSPLAEYAVSGVDGRASTALAGIIGVAVTFAVATGAFLVVRGMRQRRLTAPG